MHPDLLLHHLRRLAPKDVHLEHVLDRPQIQFGFPATMPPLSHLVSAPAPDLRGREKGPNGLGIGLISESSTPAGTAHRATFDDGRGAGVSAQVPGRPPTAPSGRRRRAASGHGPIHAGPSSGPSAGAWPARGTGR